MLDTTNPKCMCKCVAEPGEVKFSPGHWGNRSLDLR